jgi:tRNA (guanine-N7-)-methyltransferase
MQPSSPISPISNLDDSERKNRHLRSYGRVRGKKLPVGLQGLMDDFLPQISLKLDNGALDLQGGDATRYARINLEVGFGAGEHLLALAAAREDTLCIGAEPFENGVAKLLREVKRAKLQNIRVFMADARDLLQAMPDAFLDNAYILFPDPWPKNRHHKRRLISENFLQLLAAKQKPQSVLQLATDHEDYASWILAHMQHNPYYDWQIPVDYNWQKPPDIWQETKYQRKMAASGSPPMFFKYIRNDCRAALS